MKDRVSVLGVEYEIHYKELAGENADGYCDPTSKIITIRSDNSNEVQDFEELQKVTLRHEIIHAFLFESGLGFSWQHADEFGHDETTVDWFARQFAKIYKAFVEVGCL